MTSESTTLKASPARSGGAASDRFTRSPSVSDRAATLTRSERDRNKNHTFRGWLTVAAIVLAAPAVAQAAAPGWTEDKAERHIELNVSVVHQPLVDAAKEQLRRMRQIGGANGIADAEADVAAAKGGFEVTKATCLGVRKAAGGFTAFRCKLTLAPLLGWSGTARGMLSRNAVSGRWRWVTGRLVLR